jgi:hypothetical protein
MFPGSTVGGLIPGPTTGNTSTEDSSGLTEAQVQTLIDTSLTGAVQPSSVTVSGGGQVKATGGFNFDTSAVPDGQESSIERESNGGMLLKRGGTTFLTLSPFTGATFGVNLTAAQNLTVNGSFSAAGGISGMYTTTQTDNLLAAKQDLLSDQTGTGVTLKSGNSLRRIFGNGGISVTIPLNLANSSDPDNFNLKIDGSTLQTSITGKQDALTSSSSVTVGTLSVASAAEVSLIRAPASSSLTLANSNGTVGLTVNASNGHVGIQRSPLKPLHVNGEARVDGTLSVGSSATPWEIFEDASGDLYVKKGTQHFIGFGASSNPDTIYFLVATASYSDKRLKDDVEDLPDEDCLSLLKSVSAKSYVRNDLVDSERRCGFIAQDVEAAAASSLGSNLVGEASRGIDGTPDTIKTLSYERMSVVLWQCCRSLLARVEALEAAAAP